MLFRSEAQYVNKTRIPTLLFTTCGLYSANTLRIFAKRCRKKNLIPIQSESYRCQATDGSLLAPKMEIWFKHEKGLRNRIEQDSNVFLERLAEPLRESIPRFKLYSIINYPNKIMGQYVYKPVVYIHKSHCIKCGKCIKNCPRLSYNVSEDEMPIYQKERCIHCYRCIHQCPQQALSLSKKRRPDRTLDKCDIQR